MFISIIFIILMAMSIYESSMDRARLKLESANMHLYTYTKGVLDSLAISTDIHAGSEDLMTYQSGDTEKEKRILDLFEATTLANPNIKYCYAGFETGKLLINDYTVPEEFDSRVRPWYTAAIEKYPEISLGKPYQDYQTKEWLVAVSRAIVDKNGVLKGVISVDCTLEYVKEMMSEVIYYQSQSNYIVEGKETVFVHKNPDLLHKPVNDIVPGFSKLLNEKSGYIHYELDGKPRMAFYQKLEEADWIIISAIDSSEVIRPLASRLGLTVLMLLLLAVFLGMVQVKLYERSFVIPITSLRDRISEITTGKEVISDNDQYSNHELADIAKRIEVMAETSLRKKTDELQLILNTTSDGILVLDLEGNVIHANQKFMYMWDLPPFTNVSQITNDLLLDQISSLMYTNENSTIRIHLQDEIILEQFSCPLTDNGSNAGRLWSYRNITEQIIAEQNLERLATTDVLTGAWNRRKFMTQGALEIELVKRTGMQLSLIFLDVDYFKDVNDTYGHSAGDEALVFLTKSIKKLIRSTDLIARLGGEEFCIMAPNTDLASACVLAEKLRVFFETNGVIINQKKIQFTISLGVSSYLTDGTDLESILNAADKACYQAKALGRNRVVSS